MRTLEDIGALMEAGASRAILGTAAAADPAFVARGRWRSSPSASWWPWTCAAAA